MFNGFLRAVRPFSLSRCVMEEQPKLKVSILTAAKTVRPSNMTRTRRRHIIQREKKMKRQIIRDVNNARKYELQTKPFSVDPVLGNPDNEFMHRVRAELEDETNLSYGYQAEELEKLMYGAEKAMLSSNTAGNSLLYKSIAEIEAKKRSAVRIILNIKNSNEQDKKKTAISIARKEFARQEGDTASPEVQAAILTVKIHFLMAHVRENPKDHAHTQRTRQLVQRRQKILKYLKRTHPERYFYTIEKLGLTDDVITTEFHMDKQYLQDYKVWGDKILVKLSDKELAQKKKMEDLQKKVAAYAQLAKQRAQEIEENNRRKAENAARKSSK